MKPIFRNTFLSSWMLLLPLSWASPMQARAQEAAPPAAPARYEYSFTPAERMDDYLERTVGIESLFNAAALAGLDQARDKPEGWRQGGSGYGQRLVSRMARIAIGNTLQLGVEAVLHEDSRYTPSERTGVQPRLADSLLHSFLIKTPNGRRAPPGDGWPRRWAPDSSRGHGTRIPMTPGRTGPVPRASPSASIRERMSSANSCRTSSASSANSRAVRALHFQHPRPRISLWPPPLKLPQHPQTL